MQKDFDLKSIKEEIINLEELRDFQKKSAREFEISGDFHDASEVRLELIKTEKNIDKARNKLKNIKENIRKERIENEIKKEEIYKVLLEFDNN